MFDQVLGAPTVLMGFLPTYESIGITATILIVVLRMLQGMAIGGEFTSSIVFLAEHSPPGRRGFFASWAMFAATLGTLLGSTVGSFIRNLFKNDTQRINASVSG